MLVRQTGQTLLPGHGQCGGSLEGVVFASRGREVLVLRELSSLHLCWHPSLTRGAVVKPQTTDFQLVFC